MSLPNKTWDGKEDDGMDNENATTNSNPTNTNNGGSSSRQSEADSDAPTSMTITSDEINYLVFRYLQESGFVHSAFTFVYESMLGRTNLRNGDRSIPPGALISFLQKGLQYVGIEESLHRESKKGKKASTSVEEDVDFSLLSQPAIAALTRKDPPIQLNLPPAAAAAAVKARLETEAKIQVEKEERAAAAAADNASSLALSAVANSLTPHSALAAHAAVEQAALAQAVQAVAAAAAGGGDNAAGGPFAASGLQAMDAAIRQQQQQQQTVVSEKRGAKKGKSKKKPGQMMPGWNAMEEAVLRLDAEERERKGNPSQQTNGPQPMDMEEENDQRGMPPASAPAHAQLLLNGQHLNNHNGIGVNGKPPTLLAAEALAAVSNQQLSPNAQQLMEQQQHLLQQQQQQQQLTIQDLNEAEIDREDKLTNVERNEILELKMHSSEVFMCAWNPIFTSLIATGSGDASARIWQMNGTDAAAGLGPVQLLPHGEDPNDKKNKDVTTLEWSSDGKLLATGSYDGVARVWSRSGTLLHTLRGHKGPIFSLKWNKRGNYLLSGSYDKTTIVWDVSGSTGFVEQQFNDHQAPALDVDWKDNTTFASCSTDKTVHICKVGIPRPLKTYTGHADEVNAVKWDPSGTLLASCSDDCTAKVWDVSSDRLTPYQDFKSHRQEIYTVKWSPTGPGSANPTKQPILATASFDGSVRLWNVKDGSCIKVFSRHRDSVYSVAFSPSGDFLASGSLAGQLYIWNVQQGRPVKSFKGKGDIFEVAWNKEETRVAACFSSNIVSILDFKRELL